MQTQIISEISKHGGGRIASPKLRRSIEQCEEFEGLENDVNRYDLLLLVKRTGKKAGFSPRMIALLDYYIAFTRDIDWEEGGRPIVYQSLSKTALDMGVSERQIQILEKQLFEVGALTWNDSGNHRRYGVRCEETGQILFAYGVELTPLAYLKDELQNTLHEKQLYDRAWMETKRQISFYRRQIRALILEAQGEVGEGNYSYETDAATFVHQYDQIAVSIRTYMDLTNLRALLDQHKQLYDAVKLSVITSTHIEPSNRCIPDEITPKDSSKDDKNDVHYKYTNKKQLNKLSTCRTKPSFLQEGVNVPNPQTPNITSSRSKTAQKEAKDLEGDDIILSTGLQHVTLKQLLNIASERFRAQLPMEGRPMSPQDFIEAAYSLRTQLGISQGCWAHGCMTLSRIGAAVCVILADQASLREDNRVMRPGAYFNTMINRAKIGDLKLHKSVMGILRREAEHNQALQGPHKGTA